MKTISTAFTRPRTSSGVTSGRIVERRTTLTRSNAPASASASNESHIARERPKTTMQAPKPATTMNSVGPRAAPDREPRDRERGGERAHGRSRAEEPEPDRPDLEDVLREHGQERDRAAEENGEEVERDGAEEDARPANEAHAGEHLADVHRALGHRLAPLAQSEHACRARPARGRSRPRRRTRRRSRTGRRRAPGPLTSESWKPIDRCAIAFTRISCGTSEGVSARPEAAPNALPVPVRNASAKNGQT